MHPAEPPADKAGVVVHGMLTHNPLTGQRLAKPTHYVVAPWSQGRFSSGLEKHYLLSKGSVDKGEDSLSAAMRETAEESGINLSKLLANGIVHKHADQKFLKRHARRQVGGGNYEHFMHLYFQRLDNIEALLPYLKNTSAQGDPEIINGNPYFSVNVNPASIPLQCHHAMPDFDTMIKWMRSGFVPPLTRDDGTKTQRVTLGSRRQFKHIEKETMRRILANYEGEEKDDSLPVFTWRDASDTVPKIRSPKEFGIAFDAMDGSDKHIVKQQLKKLKAALSDAGLLRGDTADVKLDIKVRPLGLYQEGADLLPMSEYITRIVKQGMSNSRYDSNVAGLQAGHNYKHGHNHHLAMSLLEKQIGMLAPIILPEDIEEARIPCSVKFALHGMCRHEKLRAAPSR